MNMWYFFYGLLDCVAQLARDLPPREMSVGLQDKFIQLLEESEFEEFRWKTMEIFLIYTPSRDHPERWLGALHSAWKSDPMKGLRELEAVMALLAKDRALADDEEIMSSSHIDESTSQRDVGPKEHYQELVSLRSSLRQESLRQESFQSQISTTTDSIGSITSRNDSISTRGMGQRPSFFP